MQELTACNFHCGLPKLLACRDSTGNIARLDQTFCDLLHFQGAPMTAIGTNAKCRDVRYTAAIGGKAEVTRT